MASSRLVLLLGALSLLAACQKVDPQVLSFASDDQPAVAGDTPQGRITLGSDSAPQTSPNGQYKLKGRISTMDPGAGSVSGPYRLTGTVRF